MVSPISSNDAEQLRGLTQLRDNPYYQFLLAASEKYVGQHLEALTAVDSVSTLDDQVKATNVLGEIRGLRVMHRVLISTIQELTVRVQEAREQTEATPEKSQQQDQEPQL